MGRRPTWTAGRPIFPGFAHIEVLNPLHEALGRNIRGHGAALVPMGVKADTLGELGAHEARMDDTDDDVAVAEVDGEQLAGHVEGGLAGVVAVEAAALVRVAQRDAAGLAGHEDHARPRLQQARVRQPVHHEYRRHCRRRVHLDLLVPVRPLLRREVLQHEVPGADDLDPPKGFPG